MAALSLKQHIADRTVPVFIQDLGIFLVSVHQDLPLEDRRFLRIHAHIIQLVPPVHVFLHRLPIKKYNGNILGHGLIDHARSRGTVHHIDAERVAAQGDQPLHLAVLGHLTAFGVHDIQRDLDPGFHFIFFCFLLNGAPQRPDKRVVAPV